jgi:uncharacterized protein YqeY
MLKAALMNREVEKARALDGPIAQVVNQLIKQRRIRLSVSRRGRQDLVDREQAEIGVGTAAGRGGLQSLGD